MRRTILTLLAFASPLSAQGVASSSSDRSVGIAAARAQWQTVHGYIQRAAEQLPESLYNYKPTPKVRSFAELFGHIAGSEFMFCAPVRGDAPRAEDDVESKVKDKPAIGVLISREGKKDLNIFFDKQTGLIVKIEMRKLDLMTNQEVTEERFITEYQEVGGNKVAKKAEVVRDGKALLELEIIEIMSVEKIDESEFVKPK